MKKSLVSLKTTISGNRTKQQQGEAADQVQEYKTRIKNIVR